MTIRHQRGHLRCTKRKNGPSVWEFLWRENDATGNRLRRTAVIGTVAQYPTEDLALAAINGLRVSINEVCNRQRSRPMLFGDLVDHYKQTELCDRAEWYSEATKVIYTECLKTWIRPQWAMTNIRDVRTIIVENWLRQLRRKDGQPLADTTKTKIRSLMSVLFNHAIRYEWLEQGKNPARAGITKGIGWHTFRHSYATLLIANGENVKVVQALTRHGSARITVDIYSQARSPAKRAAQLRLSADDSSRRTHRP